MTATAPSGVLSDTVAMLTAALDTVERSPEPLPARLELLDQVTADLADPAAVARDLAYIAAVFAGPAAGSKGCTPSELVRRLAVGTDRGTPDTEPTSSSASAEARPGVPPTSMTNDPPRTRSTTPDA